MKPGPKPKPKSKLAKISPVTLYPNQIKKAKRVGDGNVSLGIRIMIDDYEEKV